MPEDVDPAGADAVAGASIVVRDGEILGNVEYMARTIQQAVGGDLLRIETAEEYPLEHEALVDFAAEEQEAGARPALATQIENLGQYDTIFLGYPNWWGDMPQALYTFLESYDLSGKTIIPFCPHAEHDRGAAAQRHRARGRPGPLPERRGGQRGAGHGLGPGPWAVSRPGRRRMRCERP